VREKMNKKKGSLQKIFDAFPTRVHLCNGSVPMHKGDIPLKQKLYFGCDYKDQPTIVIEWSETGRGFGEYVFYEKDGKLYCNNECDSKETVMRVMCQLVEQAIFTEPRGEDKCSVLKVSSSSKPKSTTTKPRKSRKGS
jgi:hypothetical protein